MRLERVSGFTGLVGHGCTVEERDGYMGSPEAYSGRISHGSLWPKNSLAIFSYSSQTLLISKL